MDSSTKASIIEVIVCMLIGMLAGIALFGLIALKFSNDKRGYVNEVYRHRLELSYYGAKDTLVQAIDTYITDSFPNSCMNGIAFVEKCDEADIDLLFVLSQCQLESAFATTGLGGKMNSAFNVGAYDGEGSRYMKKYKHPDLSISPYITLLKSSFLVDGKTEMDMLDNYVNKNDQRYASSSTYEANMRAIYKKLSNSEIGNRYVQFMKYKTLTGK